MCGMELEGTASQKEMQVTEMQTMQAPTSAPAAAGGDSAPTPVPAEPVLVQVEQRWFLERIAFIFGGGFVTGFIILVLTGKPEGLFAVPLGLGAVYLMGNVLLGVGKLKREALANEPGFSWKLFFAEFYKVAGILIGLMIVGAIANLGKACAGH
jgi:hypothetical protein